MRAMARRHDNHHFSESRFALVARQLFHIAAFAPFREKSDQQIPKLAVAQAFYSLRQTCGAVIDGVHIALPEIAFIAHGPALVLRRYANHYCLRTTLPGNGGC